MNILNCELARVTEKSGIEVVVVDANSVERDFGWVFRYESNKGLETGDPKKCISGNGPIVVDRHSGKLRRFGSLGTTERAISQYEVEVSAERSST